MVRITSVSAESRDRLAQHHSAALPETYQHGNEVTRSQRQDYQRYRTRPIILILLVTGLSLGHHKPMGTRLRVAN